MIANGQLFSQSSPYDCWELNDWLNDCLKLYAGLKGVNFSKSGVGLS